MSNHEHKICEHEDLRHCDKCDLILCKNCSKEWKFNNIIASPNSTGIFPISPNGTGTGYPIWPSNYPYVTWADNLS